MKKIILLASMVIVIVAQIFILGQYFVNRYDIVLGGEKFKFLVTDLAISKAKTKGYIDFELQKKISGQGDYGVMKITEDGFAELSNVAVVQPSFGAYLQYSDNGYFYFPCSRYYLKDIIDYDENLDLPQTYEAYINVRIKEGKLELMDLVVNGEKIENYIK